MPESSDSKTSVLIREIFSKHGPVLDHLRRCGPAHYMERLWKILTNAVERRDSDLELLHSGNHTHVRFRPKTWRGGRGMESEEGGPTLQIEFKVRDWNLKWNSLGGPPPYPLPAYLTIFVSNVAADLRDDLVESIRTEMGKMNIKGPHPGLHKLGYAVWILPIKCDVGFEVNDEGLASEADRWVNEVVGMLPDMTAFFDRKE